MRWSPLDKRSSPSSSKFQDDDAAAADPRIDNNNNNAKSKRNEQFVVDDESPSVSTRTASRHRHGRHASNVDQCSSSSFSRSTSSLFSRGGSRRSHTPTAAMQRTASRRSSSATRTTSRRRSKTPGPTPPPPLEVPAVNLSKIMSTGGTGGSTSSDFGRTTSRRSTTPIVFSHSSPARKKATPVEMKLECTLEELCFGAVKRISITRDVINEAGMIVKEEETLKINVKPGWIKGTKITFPGKGDEKPGYLPADIVFSIDELPHPVFRRRRRWGSSGSSTDDLELRVEVPLVKALTGCEVSLPLIGGERTSLRIDDEVIHPDYEKVIVGQGMGVTDGEGRRGDLWLRFSVRFPDRLSTKQREEIAAILRESFANE